MADKIDYKKISTVLTAGDPMDFKAYPDGSLVVIAHDGKKHIFSADQVNNALPKPAPKPSKPKSPSKTTRSPRTKDK